jgi:hypothetical protein
LGGVIAALNNNKRMKKIFATILALAMFAVSAFAEDVVYLNNGKVVKGNVIKDDGVNVEVQTNSGVLTYKKLEIRKIDQSSVVVVPETPKRAKYIDYASQDKGWWCSVEVMGGGSVDVNYDPALYPLGISFINGYRFNQFIEIGIGLGFRYYIPSTSIQNQTYYGINGLYEPKHQQYSQTDNSGNTYVGAPWSIPLFIDLRGNLISNDTRTVVPYWAFYFGYSFSNYYLNGTTATQNPLDPDDIIYDNSAAVASLGDGIFFAPTLGIKIGGPRNTLLLGISYMGQMLPRWGGTIGQGNITSTTRYTSFMCGKIAYEF